jgi:hypothetical protein
VPTWRTKVGGGRVTEHASKDDADAVVDDARRRYRAGARALRVVRIYSPDARRDRDVRDAVDRWESVVARAAGHGEPIEAVATAAGVSAREVRAIVRRRAGNSTSERR